MCPRQDGICMPALLLWAPQASPDRRIGAYAAHRLTKMCNRAVPPADSVESKLTSINSPYSRFRFFGSRAEPCTLVHDSAIRLHAIH